MSFIPRQLRTNLSGTNAWRMQLLFLVGLIILTLLLTFNQGFAQETTPPATTTSSQADQTGQDQKNPLGLQSWLLTFTVGAAGMFGGLLFGIKDKKLIIPHRSSKTIFNPGFLTDLLFGLGGGLIIYMVVPGSFNFEAGGFEVVKILAVAVVGGYGGRALVERVLAQQIKDLESKVVTMEEQTRWDAIALSMLDQHLDTDPETPPVSEQKLKEAILASSSRTKVQVFDKAREFRREVTVSGNRDLLPRVIPVFEALIEADTDNKYHRNHSQMAYTLKDKPEPDCKRAEEEITKAIEIRDQQNIGGYLIYEFTRAICKIQTGASQESILADLNRALQGPKAGDWVRKPSKDYAPGLIEWMRKNREQLKDWIEKNNIEVPDRGESDSSQVPKSV